MANKEFMDWYCSRPIQWPIHEHYSQLEMIVIPKGSIIVSNLEILLDSNEFKIDMTVHEDGENEVDPKVTR